MKEFKYEITFISRDDHKYIFKSESASEMKAVAEAEKKIMENGYEHYGYVLDDIRKI